MANQNTNNNPAPEQQQPKQAPEPPKQLTIKDKQKKVSDALDLYKGSIGQALPSFLTPERMIRVALTAMSKTPLLMDCTLYSLIGSVLTCAQLGLMPDGILGEAYLIPFYKYKGKKNQRVECQVIIGYRGLCSLAMRSGMVLDINARSVYEGDFFEYEFGLQDVLKHKPSGKKKDSTKLTHVYAVIHLKGGGVLFDVMSFEDIIDVRDESKNYKFAEDKASTVWGMYFEEMSKKTILRRTLKLAPLSSEINRAIGLDEAAEAGIDQKVKFEILEDLATPEEMRDAAYADAQEEHVEQEQEAEDVKSKDEKDSRVSKADAAIQETLNLIDKNKK